MLTIFGSLAFFPFLIYALFAFGLINAKARFDPNLEMPVALVDVGDATGTAFLVGETRLLTANHVVEGLEIGDEVSLQFQHSSPQISTTAKLIWKAGKPDDETKALPQDVAVLELNQPTDLPEDFPRLALGESATAFNRDKVILIGYPAGLPTITSGTISQEAFQEQPIFQLDVGAWQGNSGGPLISEETEEVIGILVAGLTDEYQGINLALKIDAAKSLIEKEGIYLDE